ncbi:MAG: primosomal protein N' [Candidatus Izemoplasmatales bacterium]|jgi:primosomal protein N' (replication factor Y)|nr:primosomal protein N' [Candidatus Izemoplasmatales bacterium]
MIAQVLVDVKSKNVNKTYDYFVPETFRDFIELGARVVVPFGNRKIMGFVLGFSEETEFKKELKSIFKILDLESYLNKELIELAKELSKESNVLLITVLETMLPSALKVIYKPKIVVKNYSNISENLQELFKYQTQIYLDSIPQELYSEINNEIKKDNLVQSYDIKEKQRNLSKRFVKLTSKPIEKITEKQLKVIEYLKEKAEELYIILKKQTNISDSVISTLEKNGYIEIFEKEVYRNIESKYESNKGTVTLNPIQEEVYNKIIKDKNKEKTFLLHGVTGSGKTEIYFKAIENVIEDNKNVLLLVPEIALTPMMISRFKEKFSHLVAALHSGLSSGEKYDEWRRIIRKEAKIVIGARSACFAPLENIGLIIVDECHESSYKQTSGLIYYAIDVLERRSKYHQAPLLLGSATPNIESYARAKKGYYELLEIKERALNAKMPQIEVVNMLEEFKQGNSSPLSIKLIDEINNRLEKKEQIILLINRRGFANFVICRECGFVFKCPNCDISLTYHEFSHSLKCHYCNHEEKTPHVCSKCGSKELSFMGSGTQRIEKYLYENFPSAKVYRMDNDTTRKKNSHETILNKFSKDGDILIGTQMIAKGLDFPKVTLVGIIQADSNLFVPDFRAPEKTFQLIMQVSGRSGRRNIEGNVIIQAMNPEHYAIKYACDNDYQGFYLHEMKIRRLARYSPFYYLINIILSGKQIRDIFFAGLEIAKELKRSFDNKIIVLGPAMDQTMRINNKYQATVLIKHRNEEDISEVINQTIDKYIKEDIFISIDNYSNVG